MEKLPSGADNRSVILVGQGSGFANIGERMTPLLTSGIELMLVGMGTVFVFLSLLVLATTLMSKIVARVAPVTASAAATDTVPIAVISAAIAHHRKNR
jgi:oxaloacetate decarboxylase gamma subunit